MGKLNKYRRITHKNNNYVVCELMYGENNVPVILDSNKFEEVQNLNKNWYINDKGFVITTHKTTENDIEKIKEISLHDVIMYLNGNTLNKPILHINKIGIDNRISNLSYDTHDKHIQKNLKKKSRTISLPKKCGIIPENLPSYVWYVKEDSSHADRFMVDVGDVNWKSTGSKKVSLKYKLEETKKYMRHLKNARPDLFNEYSMNGDLNKNGVGLLDDFLNISKDAGYYLNDISNANTEKYLKEDTVGLSNEEINLLTSFVPDGPRHNFR